jgi:glycine/D-amino acid oxidase-like deaminating enzyme/nitrite reductase/ring-hydroxylating ferredoxin subunit
MDIEKTFSGETVSCWMDTDPFLPPQGEKDTNCDVCIIGAGIAGLTTAYQLAKEGVSVIVVDMGPVAGGQTGRTTAHLAWAMDDRFYHLAQLHGDTKAALIGQSHKEAIDKIESIISEELIDCDFQRVDGYLFSGADQKIDELQKEIESIHKLGFQTVEMRSSIPHLPFNSGPAIKFPQQAQFHPLKYMNGLTQAIERYGGQIYIHYKVEKIEDGTPAKVTMDDGRIITAKKVVVASNTPINDRFHIHTMQAPYRTYAVAATIPKDSIPLALYWDTEDPYHYVRVAADDKSDIYDLLIIGGEDHKTGQDNEPHKRFVNLEAWARRHFPMILSFQYRWSGQVWEPVDSIAFIGKNPGDQNIFIATGDSGQGMTHGTIAGILLTDLIQGRSNPWIEIYDPTRRTLTAGSSGFEYLKENLNVAWQYTDYLKLSDHQDVESLSEGEGCVIQKGLKKIAVYKSNEGEVKELSAVCPHLGGIVHWNSVEKSWDCPCHGSRFAVDGNVITGPALHGLESLEQAPSPSPAHAAQETGNSPQFRGSESKI